MKLNAQTAPLVLGLGVALVGVLWLQRKGVAGVAADVVGAAADAGAGVVVGAGELIGLPRTNADRCAAAKASGSTWEQSLYCEAGDFIATSAGRIGKGLGDAFAWPVVTAGDALGVPRTNETECERAKREGRTWDASFACPAGDFIGYLFKG